MLPLQVGTRIHFQMKGVQQVENVQKIHIMTENRKQNKDALFYGKPEQSKVLAENQVK